MQDSGLHGNQSQQNTPCVCVVGMGGKGLDQTNIYLMAY